MVEIDTIAFIKCSTTISVTPRPLTVRKQIERFIDFGRVEAGHHFIEQQDFGIERERFRDFEPLAIGDRQVARVAVADARETDDLEQFLRAVEARRASRALPSRPNIAPTATFSRTRDSRTA